MVENELSDNCIKDLKREISTIEWDLPNIKNKDLIKLKTERLKQCNIELRKLYIIKKHVQSGGELYG